MTDEAFVWFGMWFASWVTVTGSLWKLFERAEKAVSPEGRELARRWLVSATPGQPIRIVAGAFSHAFDGVFGERHFTLSCFIRSCVASVLFTAGLSFLSLRELDDDRSFRWGMVHAVLIAFGNLIPDYASLLKTRMIVGLLNARRRTFVSIMLLCVDAALSLALGFFAFLLFFSAFGTLLEIDDGQSLGFAMTNVLTFVSKASFPMFLRLALDGLSADPHLRLDAVPIYATFMTSFWMWLFIAAPHLTQAAQWLDSGFAWLRGWIDIEKQPLISMGALSIFVVTVLYLIAIPVALVR